MGSGAIAGMIAQAAFWAMLVLGVAFGEIGRRGVVVFLALWAVGFFGLPRVSAFGALYVTPYVAALDIGLAFVVFKGDVKLS